MKVREHGGALTHVSAAPTDLFAGPGEMCARCLAFDWSATPLGPPSTWSMSLRTTVTTMLASRHPMFLWWGAELVQIFNDGYLPSFGTTGRDRSALGARGREHWAEIWPVIGPQIESVMMEGAATWHEDQLIPIERNGHIDDVWWTYGYSPVRDDDGSVGGVLVVVQETTARVLALADRERLLAAERAARAEAEAMRAQAELERSRLGEVFRRAPAFMAVVRGENFVFEMVNEAYYQLVGYRDLIGKPLFDVLPEVRGQGFEERLRSVTDTGEPFIGHELPITLARTLGAPLEQRYVTFTYAPFTEADGSHTGVFVHGVDVTDHVRARRQIECARDEAEAARARAAHLYALSAALSTASTADDVAGAAVEHASAVFGAVGIVIGRLSENGEELELVRVGGMPDDVRDKFRHMALDVSAPLTDVARTREPLFLESRAAWTRHYPHLASLLDATGHVANAVAPLVANGRVLGVMGAAFDTPRLFGLDERALVIAVAAQCAQALERARLYEAERDAREEAEAANRAKSEFLAVMSHELRTPLSAIDGYAELMELGLRGALTEEQRHDLARIREGQRSLLGLVNGVLNYSRVNAGAVEYEREHFSIDAVLTTCQGLLMPQARARRLELSYTPCDPRLTVKSDREKLQQIVVNLLTNAVKFTEPGGRVELKSEAASQELRITVADTGRGIPADQLSRIFEPFVQVDARLTRSQGGVGLGLAISRELARGMGGDLTVDSTLGGGSTFVLSVPME